MNEMIGRAVGALEFLPYSATDEERVRAVLVAMREPTEAMVESVRKSIGRDHRFTEIFPPPKDVWQTMVDEMLK